MPSLDEFINRARQSLPEIDTDTLAKLAQESPETVIIDVREREETAKGAVPGALLIPRGILEFEIERAVPRRNTPLAIYCSHGVRSVLSALSLGGLGYTQVSSVAGGFDQYLRAGHPVETPRALTPTQRERYSRHLVLPEIGDAGQLKLHDARVLCVGAGGLGSPAALYLAAAGVGTLGILDDDLVDLSNLQRQILHNEARVGLPKVDSAAATIRGLNSEVHVVTHPTRLTRANAIDILSQYDIIVDGSDNFPTRYLVCDACVMLGLPNVHGSIFRFDGQATVFAPGRGPCYRCLYPEPPPAALAPNCREAGVLGVLPGLIGVIQAVEVIKLIVGIGDPLIGRLLAFDALSMAFHELRLRRDPDCPVCGDRPTITELLDYNHSCSAP